MPSVFAAHYSRSETTIRVELPDPATEILPGVVWGRHERFGSPSYWKYAAGRNPAASPDFTIGRSLIEEIAVCLLGGFGMPADLGLAAFSQVRSRGLLDRASSEEEILATLLEPLTVGSRQMRYRYPGQKSRYLAKTLATFYSTPVLPVSCAVELRKWLLSFPGIGLKTASWIVRNHLASNDVAILDVHIVRAGQLIGIFSQTADVTKDYLFMERAFLEFAKALDVPASLLDALMWQQMRVMPLKLISTLRAA